MEEAGLPLVGQVAAGSPMMAIENMLGRYPVDPSLFTPRADYLLQVRGLSMRDEGILDGDWLVVHKTTQAKNGQLVVARVGDDVTVKRFKIRGHKAELIPANPDFQTLYFDLTRHTLAIEGIAVGVIRNLGARAVMKCTVAELAQLPGVWRGGEFEHAPRITLPTGHTPRSIASCPAAAGPPARSPKCCTTAWASAR